MASGFKFRGQSQSEDKKPIGKIEIPQETIHPQHQPETDPAETDGPDPAAELKDDKYPNAPELNDPPTKAIEERQQAEQDGKSLEDRAVDRMMNREPSKRRAGEHLEAAQKDPDKFAGLNKADRAMKEAALTPDSKPAGGAVAAAAKLAGARLPGLSRRRAAMGGTVITIVAILGLFFINFPHFQLDTLMNNVFKHAFKRTTHSYTERQAVILKFYFRQRFDPNFNLDGPIVNYQNSVFQNLYSKLRDGDLEDRLSKAGYTITYGGQNGDPKYRILTIRHEGDPDINAGNFATTYDTTFQKKEARAHVKAIYDELYHDQGWIKRISIKARLTKLTGTKWHWLDPIKQPLAKARQKVANEVVLFIIQKVPLAQRAAISLLALLTGEKLTEADAQQSMTEINTELATEAETKKLTTEAIETVFQKVLTQKLTTAFVDLSNPIGWGILAFTISCALDELMDSGYDKLAQIAKDKSTTEYIIAYSAWQSKQSQIKQGFTDGAAVDASMNMLVDEGGRDWSLSNNTQRTFGHDVPFNRSDNCESGIELCDAKRPQSILEENVIAKALKFGQDVANSPWRFVPVSIMTPGSVTAGAACRVGMPVINAAGRILGAAMGGIMFVLRHLPVVGDDLADMEDWLKSNSADVISKYVLDPFTRFMFKSVVDADTRGPHLANAVNAGASGASNLYLRDSCGDTSAFGDPEAAKQCKLSNEEIIALEGEANQQIAADFKRESLWTKLTSREYPQSVASQIALHMPSTPGVALSRMSKFTASIFSPRLSLNLASGGGLLLKTLTTNPASAAEPKYVSPVGIDDYGYNEPCLKNAPLNADSEQSGCVDQFGNKLPINKLDTSVGCAMLAGQLKPEEQDELPSQCDELAGPQNAPGLDPGDLTGALCSDRVDCATKILATNKIKSRESAPIRALELTAEGKMVPVDATGGQTYLSVSLLRLILALTGKYDSITIDYLANGRHSANSKHYTGRAMDVNLINGRESDGLTALDRQFLQDAANFMVAPELKIGGGGIGQLECAPINTPPGVDQFEDPCNHLHVGVN